MQYDIEKYRDKRERVLGKKRRGIKFGTVLTIVSIIIVMGFGFALIPRTVAYFITRNFDDAVYKIEGRAPSLQEFSNLLMALNGIKDIASEKDNARVIITFDRTELDIRRLTNYLEEKGVNLILLNRVSHRQRLKINQKEKKFETP